ncbi:DUF4230 domain-containing protein [Pseudofulvibacter geojedonensis]|uniref:DUF4230 domain-containing protein n=1 Tax=Pseudofulvibacter geojedonensis TaxID=1123758 RepID=A0ABW3HZX0_9FLAO
MESLVEAVLGIILGAIIAYWLFNLFKKKNSRELTERQSVILLEKIKKVCKLITVEGDFSEIYHYENTTEHLFKLIPSKKKALVVVNAKASVGYDLSKIIIEAQNNSKTVKLTQFPEPEVLSIETDFKYYDKKDGIFNRFGIEDLTNLNKEAKAHILDKIPESGLIDSAKKEALESILLMEAIVATIGWKLDYKTLELPE